MISQNQSNEIITLDNGNTRSTIGIFKDSNLSEVTLLDKEKKQKYSQHPWIVSDVGRSLDLNWKDAQIIFIKDFKKLNSFLDMDYQYSQNLGDDRVATAYYCYKNIDQFADKTWIIDAGTYITIDLVTKNGPNFGPIFPGLDLFINNYNFSSRLEEKNKTFPENFNLDFAHDTESAKKLAFRQYLIGIFNFIETKTAAKDKMQLIFTGGNGNYLELMWKELINKNQGTYKPNLVHNSLFYIWRHLCELF